MSDLVTRLRVALGERYEILRELGRGGTAYVFLVRDRKHDRHVALKLLRPELAFAVGSDRFLREIRVAAQLQHPHILSLYDSGEAGSYLYYVMPYVEGESLRERLEREPRLPIPLVLAIVRDAAGALGYAHERGVVHRDIKPENILLAGEHALIADFGIAHAFDRAVTTDAMRETGLAIGTPAYMSPEQASGGDDVDGRCDQYSLACVLYEMLAGEPPFTGPTVHAVIAKRFASSAPLVRAARPEVPVHVERAIATALARDPADRFPSMGAFAEALAAAGVDNSREASRPASRHATRTATRTTTRTARPGMAHFGSPWRRWTLGAAAVCTIGAGAVGAALYAARTRAGNASAVRLSASGSGAVASEAGLDAATYAILPFREATGRGASMVSGQEGMDLMHDALARWADLTVTSTASVDDAMRALGATTLDGSTADSVARRLRARYRVAGEIGRVGDQLRITASLYDVARRAEEAAGVVYLAPGASDHHAKFGELARMLVLGGKGKTAMDDGPEGTAVLAAYQAYARGRRAVAEWDLGAAKQAFRDAIAADPSYARPRLWLARANSWSGENPTPESRADAEQAVRLSASLGPRERLQAEALLALAEQRYPAACASYRKLLRADPTGFEPWYGLGECQRRDSVLVRDARSPSGWAFRSSYHRAAEAYQKAFNILPTAYRAYRGQEFSRLPKLLSADASAAMLRMGRPEGDPSKQFGAYASFTGDTLAFVPYPVDEISSTGGLRLLPTYAAAVRHQRMMLRQITSAWSRSFPQSADALEQYVRALELSGELAAPGGSGTSALAEVRRARTLTTDSALMVRLVTSEVRLLTKALRFDDARAITDSVLAYLPHPSARDAAMLAALAALTGRVDLAARLAAQTAVVTVASATDGRRVEVPPDALEASRALEVYAVFAPHDSLDVLRRRIEASIEEQVEAERRSLVRNALLHQPTALAFPALGLSTIVPSIGMSNSYLREMQRLVQAHDHAGLSAAFQVLARNRIGVRPGDLPMDAVYQEAKLLVAVGDTAAAAAHLDGALNFLSRSGTALVNERVVIAASLGPAIALRAALAARTGDDARAQKWARALVALWKNADRALQPTVIQMRGIADAPRR